MVRGSLGCWNCWSLMQKKLFEAKKRTSCTWLCLGHQLFSFALVSELSSFRRINELSCRRLNEIFSGKLNEISSRRINEKSFMGINEILSSQTSLTLSEMSYLSRAIVPLSPPSPLLSLITISHHIMSISYHAHQPSCQFSSNHSYHPLCVSAIWSVFPIFKSFGLFWILLLDAS